jgi:hypothetical protein
MSGKMSGKMSRKMSGKMSRKMSRKMSKKMSRKMSGKRISKSNKMKNLISKSSNSFAHGNSNYNYVQNGGFASCNLATVQEPEFNVPALGDIAGLNIAKSRGVIYRPDCKPDTYQAMIP